MRMKLMFNYNTAEQALYEHVGFQPDWVMCPIDDCTDKVWAVDEKNGKVRYAHDIEDFESDGDYFEDDIYTQRFYPKHIYEGEIFTMVMCDPHTDGVKWFRFFDNSKKRSIPKEG